MDEILLRAEGLKKYYVDRHGLFSGRREINRAVDGVSLEVRRGHTLGLAGESGCGKSTTGKLLLNLLSPTGGKVYFKDQLIFDAEEKKELPRREMADLRSRMQLIFQDPYSSLNPRQNVEQIISAGIRRHNLCQGKEIREACGEIMEKCGLDRRQMMRYPHEFSGGQRQRIGIARALAVKPDLVVCDEPTAALDMSVQSQILNLMLDMKEQLGLTYLFISHNLGVMEHFCDELAIMYRGRIAEQGETKEVLSHPLHPYTKLLLSSVPVKAPWERRERRESREEGRPGRPASEAEEKRSGSERIAAVKGQARDSTGSGSGCLFAPRCPYRTEACEKERPLLRQQAPGHWAACHAYEGE